MEIKKNTREKLMLQLENEGYAFSELVLTSEGDYAVDDADWNYKDIPHLHHVHEAAESFPAVIGRDIVCSINLQSIFGIWLPVALVNYEFEKHRQIYFTTLLFFALIIETRSEAIGPLRTKVTTRYSIGHPKWMFFLVPLLKFVIKRNYRILMAADIPMRDRRGELRKLGYAFIKDGDTYSFPGTMNIMAENLRPPEGAPRTVTCEYREALSTSGTALMGDAGLIGARLVREGEEVVIYRRTCPHEGASLDKRDCSGGFVVCEWHGRRLAPIGRIPWNGDAHFTNEGYEVRAEQGRLWITYLGGAQTGAQQAA